MQNGQSTPHEEKDRARQTTWANCLRQKYLDAVHCRHAIRANHAITQHRITRPLNNVDQAQTMKPIGTHVVAGLRRQSGQETSSPTADKRGAMHRKWRHVEQQEKMCNSSSNSTSKPHSTQGCSATMHHVAGTALATDCARGCNSNGDQTVCVIIQRDWDRFHRPTLRAFTL